ncbi:MAG: hypothetical protein M3291_02615 [Actinomycetota bacterium]|nr:hypothetical protein [Actinomycetota bacterium]
MSTTIRGSEQTRRRAAALAESTGTQMQAVVDEALIAYERAIFWESFEASYARLADHADEWNGVVAERRGEELALADGLGRTCRGAAMSGSSTSALRSDMSRDFADRL